MAGQFQQVRLRCVLADDVEVLRDVSRMLLDQLGWIEVCAEAKDGAEALAAIERLRPDIALLDQRMPNLTGFGVAARVRELGLPMTIIIFSAFLSSAQREFLMRLARAFRSFGGRPRLRCLRVSFQNSRRILSTASLTHFTMWNASMHTTAFSHVARTVSWIQAAPSGLACVMSAQRSSPSSSENRLSVALLRPRAAQINLPESWHATTVR